MSQRIIVVDAFTSRAFAGNPAAVCVLERPAAEDWMRSVAREMNLSETAFLHPEGEAYRIRWLTPAAEVDLCGHATLASAHVLFTEYGYPRPEIRLTSRSGSLSAARSGDLIELDFPEQPAAAAEPPAGLLAALGAPPVRFVGKARTDWLIELDSATAVRELRPDFARLATLDARGVIVTAAGDDGRHDCISRFFAPGVGVAEDPVTGSAHCTLGPYWAEKLGKTELSAYQASRRGGWLRVRLVGGRVRLAGSAVTVLRGELA